MLVGCQRLPTLCAFLALTLQIQRACTQTEPTEPHKKRKLVDLRVAMSMKKAGRLDEAESMLRAHLKAHPDHFSYLMELGLVLVQQGKRDQVCYCWWIQDQPWWHGSAAVTLAGH